MKYRIMLVLAVRKRYLIRVELKEGEEVYHGREEAGIPKGSEDVRGGKTV